MHIPDGFLSKEVLVSTNIVGYSVLALAILRLKEVSYERIPLMGVLASFIFLLQLLAFPVIGGTSVHLDGVVLCSVILGPFSSSLIVFCTLLMQAFLFQHGGMLSLGANFLNIGIVGSFLGYLLWGIRPTKFLLAVSTLVCSVISAVFCSFELYFSKKLVLSIGLPIMLTAHLIAGVIEGVFVYGVWSFIEKVKPEVLKLERI